MSINKSAVAIGTDSYETLTVVQKDINSLLVMILQSRISILLHNFMKMQLILLKHGE